MTHPGFGGNDVLKGEGGNDLIEAGEGADTVTGGTGNDTLKGGNGLDVAIYSGNYANYTITEISYNIHRHRQQEATVQTK